MKLALQLLYIIYVTAVALATVEVYYALPSLAQQAVKR